MSLSYQKELDFTAALLRRLRLPVHFIHQNASLMELDDGLRRMLGMAADYQNAYQVISHWSSQYTIYTIIDQFQCHYIYFHLPEYDPPTAIVIGPYLTEDPSHQAVLEMAEQLGLSINLLPKLSEQYASLPVFNDPGAIMAIITTLGEAMWGGSDTFEVIDVNYDQQRLLPASVTPHTPIEQENILERMAQLEQRYAYENELMEIVAKGMTARAELMMSSVSGLNYQNRTADPLRNMKNYCIICNTLLRKAAQNGGVHPLHLDKMSSQFARQIETAPTLEKASGLIGEMIRAYCRLVRTHAGQQHSSTIQKTLVYIDANLSGDLSLRSLARLMQVSPGYLSTLFHRETGQTLAAHITTLRMRTALHLLKSSHLQVQTVAQLCGYADPNYFGKQFRKFYGLTPLQYRKDQQGAAAHGEG